MAVLTSPLMSDCDGPEGARMECGPLKREVSEFAVAKEGRGSNMEKQASETPALAWE